MLLEDHPGPGFAHCVTWPFEEFPKPSPSTSRYQVGVATSHPFPQFPSALHHPTVQVHMLGEMGLHGVQAASTPSVVLPPPPVHWLLHAPCVFGSEHAVIPQEAGAGGAGQDPIEHVQVDAESQKRGWLFCVTIVVPLAQ